MKTDTVAAAGSGPVYLEKYGRGLFPAVGIVRLMIMTYDDDDDDGCNLADDDEGNSRNCMNYSYFCFVPCYKT